MFAMAVSLTAAGCSSRPAARTAEPAPPTARHWLVSDKALRLLGSAGMDAAQQAAVFDTPQTYLTSDSADVVSGFSRAVRTQTFTSVDALRTALEANRLAPGVRAILYDDENWPLTSVSEQRDPDSAQAQAASLARAHGLQLIAAPATDLSRVLAPGERGYDAYLRLNLAGGAARSADVVDIQAQGSESDAATYTDFVRRAAAQARAANPKVVVLAGISTNPSGRHVTADQLRAAIAATSSTVDGYWLNIPAAGTACPRCGQPRPDVAVDLLR
jgi:Tfp pilus assembly protein PilV